MARRRIAGELMETRPTCNSQLAVLIVNVQSGKQFCHHCAHEVCPTFMPNFVLTEQDVKFLAACGIDPQVSGITAVLHGRTALL